MPIALALAWAFDLSSMGPRREVSARPDTDGLAYTTATASLWQFPSFWIALALGAGLAVSAQQAWQRIVNPAFGERPGIAVLPFANLSPDPADAYFADGLHEEIHATLARISGLRVISRTSVQEFRDSKRNLRDKALAARASYLTYVERDAVRALRDLDRALELAPNDADTHGIAGLTKRRLGRFDEAIAHFREAARLMPAHPQHPLRVFETLEGLGRLAEAEQERVAFAQRFPDWRAPAELSGFRVRFLATGATDGWRKAYERLAPGLSPADRYYFFGHLRPGISPVMPRFSTRPTRLSSRAPAIGWSNSAVPPRRSATERGRGRIFSRLWMR